MSFWLKTAADIFIFQKFVMLSIAAIFVVAAFN